MIPKSSRFKCERCGWLKRKPGKCVACGKVADFNFSAAVEAQTAINPPGRNWAQKAEPTAGNTLMVATIEKRIDSGVRRKPTASEIMLPSPISPDKPDADGQRYCTASDGVSQRYALAPVNTLCP